MEIKGYIYAKINEYRLEGEGRYAFYIYGHTGMEEVGYIRVREVSFDLDVPDEKELDLKTVEVLKARLVKVRADHYREENAIQTQIDNLLALENKSETVQ